jgi:hypothetical protein
MMLRAELLVHYDRAAHRNNRLRCTECRGMKVPEQRLGMTQCAVQLSRMLLPAIERDPEVMPRLLGETAA